LRDASAEVLRHPPPPLIEQECEELNRIRVIRPAFQNLPVNLLSLAQTTLPMMLHARDKGLLDCHYDQLAYIEESDFTLDIVTGQSNGDCSAGLLTVAGNAQLDGVLRVSFADGYTPAAGDQFSLQFLSAGSTSGAFSEIDLPPLPAGESWMSSDIPNGRLTVVPEPYTLAVSLIAIAWGLSRRRRR